jgi:hypothetical protein
MDITVLVQQAVALFQHHQPWLAEKLGGAAVTQAVKELWERAKAKLGGEAAEKVEQHPDDATQWELLKAKLLLALNEDKAFAENVRELVEQSGGSESAGISQTAQGIGIKQAAVHSSEGVYIRQK